MRKMSVRSIPIYIANLATFEENWILGVPFGRPYAYDVWNFTLIIYFSTLRIFYVEMASSDGGEGGGSAYP